MEMACESDCQVAHSPSFQRPTSKLAPIVHCDAMLQIDVRSLSPA